MSVVAQVAALVGAVVHLLAFAWETILFGRPAVHRDIFRVPTADVPAATLWAFNVGIYNLCVSAGAAIGVGLWWSGQAGIGRALVLYTCAFMLVCGLFLFVSDRMALSRPRGSGIAGSIVQSTPGLLGVIGALSA